MSIETLAVIFIIAGIAALIARLISGIHLAGCLTTYVLACLGAVGGWYVQQQYLVPDQLLSLPWEGRQVPVSVIGASVGALLVALLGRGIGQPMRSTRRRRRRY